MKRVHVLAGIAVLAFCAASAFWLWSVSPRSVSPQAAAPRTPSPERVNANAGAALAPVFEAEKIDDPMQRCVAYPPLPNAHWSRAMIEAFCADTFTPTLTWEEFENAIDQGKAAELDARLDAMVEGYFARRIPEGALYTAYADTFWRSSARLENLLERWRTASPKSAHALIAHGIYELARASEARGEDTVQNTPLKKLERMQTRLVKARADLEQGISISARIMPAYANLIHIAKFNGDDALADETMRKAISVDPATYYTRAELMSKYEPRWGGSFEAMDRLAASSAPLATQNPRMANLKATALAARGLSAYLAKDYATALKHFDAGLVEGPVLFYLDLANYAASQAGDHEKAVEFASQVLRFFPRDSKVRLGRAYDLMQIARYDWAESDLRRALDTDPTNIKTLRSYADLSIRRGDNAAAEARIKAVLAIDPVDDWATSTLAWLYAHRLNRLDDAVAVIDARLKDQPESGALWLMKVRTFDSVDEGPRMREAVESFLRYADEKSDEQRSAVPIAKHWLSTHPAATP
jgi:tetratricopeptide (TPR) repeat protein